MAAIAVYIIIVEVMFDALSGSAVGIGVADAGFTLIAVSAYELPYAFVPGKVAITVYLPGISGAVHGKL